MAWKVEFYQSKRGDYPVADFIADQELRVRQKVSDSIKMLNESGPYLMSPYMKKLLPNLYELRIKSRVAIRIFYSPKTGIYYLLHAFVKKSQKTPEKELKIALDRMKEII